MQTLSPPPVVVGVSGSPASQWAVEAGAREAAMHGCPVHLVHVFNWLPTFSRPGEAVPRPDREELLRRAVVVAAREAPAATITTHVLEGSAVTGLLRNSRTAAMIVIGDGRLCDRVCLPHDAVAAQVAARALCTVMVTRAAPPSGGPILAGVTASASGERTLDFAFDAAARHQTSVLVVHAWDGESRDRDQCVSALTDLVAARENKYGVEAHLRVLTGDPIPVLRRASEEAALVVVGARGDRAYRGLLGSASQTLLHHSPAPVVIVRGLMPAVVHAASTPG